MSTITHLRNPTQEQLQETYTDITAPKVGVSVTTNHDETVLWVNVDGICVLRICQIPALDLPDTGFDSCGKVTNQTTPRKRGEET